MRPQEKILIDQLKLSIVNVNTELDATDSDEILDTTTEQESNSGFSFLD